MKSGSFHWKCCTFQHFSVKSDAFHYAFQHFSWKCAFHYTFHEKWCLKSTWKATKIANSTQISHFDLVFYRIQMKDQLGITYILVIFGGAHVCLVVHVCVYGTCIHTYAWSFVLHDFIMDFMKSNTILLKPKWFYEISNDLMKSNWILQRVTRFHKIHMSLQDYIKSRGISWNLWRFH